jgi:hypothetical protein
MPLSRRYSPEWSPGETASIGIDMSNIIPPGVGINVALLRIQTNTVPPQDASTDWTGTAGTYPMTFAANIVGRAAYSTMTGGVSGKDYQLTWNIEDTDGNNWNRTALLLCAPTS